MPINLYIVEDHPFMRQMIWEFLTRIPYLRVCGMANTAQSALEDLTSQPADLVLVDVALPDMDGIYFVREARRRHPDLHCLMFSSHEEATYIERALNSGARGYVAKGEPAELLVAIDRVMDGQIYLSEPARAELRKVDLLHHFI